MGDVFALFIFLQVVLEMLMKEGRRVESQAKEACLDYFHIFHLSSFCTSERRPEVKRRDKNKTKVAEKEVKDKKGGREEK